MDYRIKSVPQQDMSFQTGKWHVLLLCIKKLETANRLTPKQMPEDTAGEQWRPTVIEKRFSLAGVPSSVIFHINNKKI